MLLSVVAGALGRYLREIGTDTAGLVIRATVPVNLRPMDEELQLGNRFGLVLLDLPVGLEHPLERLYAVRAAMQALKDSCQPAATFAVRMFSPRVLTPSRSSMACRLCLVKGELLRPSPVPLRPTTRP